MVEILLKGILIGIIVSAPMGPVGMLCVRRTMLGGKRQGMLTGLGATLSDIIYAFLTLLGVGAFVDFIVKYSSLLQLVGSLLVICFALYVMFSNHSIATEHQQRRKKPRKWCNCINFDNPQSDLQVFLSAFALTFSNVLIVLLYIGLFAQFSFVTDSVSFESLFLGLAGVVIGALSWWYMVTGLLIKVKEWFNVRSLKYFNRGIGGLLCIMGIIGIIEALKGLFA